MSAVNAIVEEAIHQKVKRNCYFFYGARTQNDLYLVDELTKISEQWDKDFKFEFVPVLSEEPEDSDWDGARGFVTDYFKINYLEKGIVSADSCKAFFCGPPPMIDAGAKVLKEAGVAESSMFFDKFEDARSPAPVIDNSKCVLCDECLLVKPTAGCIVETAKLGKLKDNGKYADIERIDPAYTSGLYYNTLYINEDECIRCYACVHACPAKAISPQYDLEPKTLRETVET
jgi:ferredoxin